MAPEQRAQKYRLIAGEIRGAARAVAMDESRTSLLNLANAYERMANAAAGPLKDAADAHRSSTDRTVVRNEQAFARKEPATHS